jgi:hypothetical protein
MQQRHDPGQPCLQHDEYELLDLQHISYRNALQPAILTKEPLSCPLSTTQKLDSTPNKSHVKNSIWPCHAKHLGTQTQHLLISCYKVMGM